MGIPQLFWGVLTSEENLAKEWYIRKNKARCEKYHLENILNECEYQ